MSFALSTLVAPLATTTTTVAPTYSPGMAIGYGIGGLIINGLVVWGMLGKAGLPKWGGFVPLYGSYLTCKMAGYNGWMFLLLLIPVVNFVFSIMLALRLAKAFGHGGAFGFFLMWLLSIIGFLICSYGSDTYRNPVTGASTVDGQGSVYA